jgi:hypothetical protein
MSPRANRAVKRFVDRNFYANRYDYRREWERVSRGITPTARPEDICRQIDVLLRSVFDAERVVVHLRDDRNGGFRRVHPPSPGAPAEGGTGVAGGEVAGQPGPLAADNRLVRHVDELKAPLVFRDIAQDLDLIPVVVENRDTILAMKAAVCAPLHVGDDLVGLLWLSGKRGDEEYTFEDVEFLGTMARQLAAALWFAHVADQLAETRQLESLNRLSTFVLHDIKNQVSGLSLVVENARRHLADPEFQRDAMKVVERTVQNLRDLMAHVSGVGRPAVIQVGPCRVREVLDDAIAGAGLSMDGGPVRFAFTYAGDDVVMVDRGQLVRVVTNLLTNAREAVAGRGEIELGARVERNGAAGRQRQDGEGEGWLTVFVRDTGPGMSPEFVRESLFRPFATTKPSGLGVGLMQCKGIVEAHGGSISVESRLGRGTRFEIRVPIEDAPAAELAALQGAEEDER